MINPKKKTTSLVLKQVLFAEFHCQTKHGG